VRATAAAGAAVPCRPAKRSAGLSPAAQAAGLGHVPPGCPAGVAAGAVAAAVPAL